MKRYLRDYWSLRRLNLSAAIASLLFVGISAACTESDVVANPPIGTPRTTASKFPAGTERAFKEGVLADDPSVDSGTLNCMWEWVEDNLTLDDVIAMGSDDADIPAEYVWSLLEDCPSLWGYAR